MSINEDTGSLTLISDKPTYKRFRIEGENYFGNLFRGSETDVENINEACNQLYGSAICDAKNLDIADIPNYKNEILDEILYGMDDELFYYEDDGEPECRI